MEYINPSSDSDNEDDQKTSEEQKKPAVNENSNNFEKLYSEYVRSRTAQQASSANEDAKLKELLEKYVPTEHHKKRIPLAGLKPEIYTKNNQVVARYKLVVPVDIPMNNKKAHQNDNDLFGSNYGLNSDSEDKETAIEGKYPSQPSYPFPTVKPTNNLNERQLAILNYLRNHNSKSTTTTTTTKPTTTTTTTTTTTPPPPKFAFYKESHIENVPVMQTVPVLKSTIKAVRMGPSGPIGRPIDTQSMSAPLSSLQGNGGSNGNSNGLGLSALTSSSNFGGLNGMNGLNSFQGLGGSGLSNFQGLGSNFGSNLGSGSGFPGLQIGSQYGGGSDLSNILGSGSFGGNNFGSAMNGNGLSSLGPFGGNNMNSLGAMGGSGFGNEMSSFGGMNGMEMNGGPQGQVVSNEIISGENIAATPSSQGTYQQSQPSPQIVSGGEPPDSNVDSQSVNEQQTNEQQNNEQQTNGQQNNEQQTNEQQSEQPEQNDADSSQADDSK